MVVLRRVFGDRQCGEASHRIERGRRADSSFDLDFERGVSAQHAVGWHTVGQRAIRLLHRRGGDHRSQVELFRDECLIRDVPNQAGEFVALQEPIESDRDVIGHRSAQAIQVAADEDHLIEAGTAVEPIALSRQHRLALRIRGQVVGQDLEQVVARSAEEQIAVLPIQPAAQDVVAGTAEDPIFRRTADECIVPFAAEQHIATHQVLPRLPNRIRPVSRPSPRLSVRS